MKKQWNTIFSHLRLTFIKRKNRIRLTESSFSLWLSNITHIMSKSLALCSAGGNFAKPTDKRSGGCVSKENTGCEPTANSSEPKAKEKNSLKEWEIIKTDKKLNWVKLGASTEIHSVPSL